jgi:hypothetical protein
LPIFHHDAKNLCLLFIAEVSKYDSKVSRVGLADEFYKISVSVTTKKTGERIP